MSERKVLNKYYPPDFDPSKIPRMKLAKNRQYTVRLMAPFNMRCATCGEYIYKGKKFNARKEDVENQDYLGIRIYRFYIKCTRCLQEISFKTDPKNTDYEIEAGATRNFMALKLAEEQAKREEEEQKEEEANNPMKLLEYRTEQSRQEIELLESLEELKELNRRQRAVDYEGMLQQYQPETAEARRAREEKEDDDVIKSIKFGGSSTQKVIAEEIIEEVEDDEPPAKTSRIEVVPKTEVKKNESWNRSIGVLNKKPLANLVKPKKPELVVPKTSTVTSENGSANKSDATTKPATGLTLLANYSGSDSDSQYKEVFAEGLGRYTGGTVALRVRENARPVFLRARPLAYALREPVERALDQLERDGVVTPVDVSDWATPIVPVVKRDGSIRICGDYKLTLNKCLEVDRFPLPRVDDLLVKLHGGKKFSKIDLSQAYAQLELDEASKDYTVINTHRGLYKYNRLIYGLSSSPGIFQRKLEQMFMDMPRVGVFLDDVILTGADDEEHLSTLYQVLERLKKFGLRVKKEKCSFFAESVTYLGFVISQHGIHTCPEKIEVIKNMAIPRNVTELRSFLGMIMYYGKFIKNISMVLAPLYELLRKNAKFIWSKECSNAFNKVKNLLISSTVLVHYDPELPLVLTTDASASGVGAVISHQMPEGNERPIAYASRVLNTAEANYSQIQKEALAIIYGVKKFHQFLYGRKFTLRTDHKPLVSIFGEKGGIPTMAASRLQRWAVILSGYRYDIEYVPTDKNAADALSRLPVGKQAADTQEITYVHFVQEFLPITSSRVRESLKNDELMRKVVLYLKSGWPSKCDSPELQPFWTRRHELYLEADCIMWGYRMVLPSAVIGDVLRELHVGHAGVVKMKSLARSYVWWPGIDGDIETTCRECTACALEAPAPARSAPSPWPYVKEPWSRLHIDFLGPLYGKTYMVVIDASTKWLEVQQMLRTTATEVVRVLREIFARFGLPKMVVTDNGPPFTSSELGDFMRHSGIEHIFTAIYHPASNGAAENAVKHCKKAIKKALSENKNVEAALQSYLLAYRNSVHCSTGQSPAQLLQHRALRSRLDLLRADGGAAARDCAEAAQRRQTENAGGASRAYEAGDHIWARNFSKGEKWVKGDILEKLGSRNYLIRREDGQVIKRHIDQIRGKSRLAIAATPAFLAGSQGTSTSAPSSLVAPEPVPKRIPKPVIRYGDPILY